VLGFNTGWLLADWLVEKINPDMTSYRMLLDVTVPPNKNRYNKCLILIRYFEAINFISENCIDMSRAQIFSGDIHQSH
jgi:hypothetical protein